MFAVLDLGSNSFHLLVAEKPNGNVKFLRALSYKVRLAEGVSQDGKISKAARERAIKALRAIRLELTDFKIKQICVVGTSTFREAENATKIIDDAAELGFKVQVIAGIQEAFYIYRGLQEFLHHSRKPVLVFDIGGGSTEFAFGKGNTPDLVDSITLGCVTNNLPKVEVEKVTVRNLARLRRSAHDIMEKQLRHSFYTADWGNCYATSGTAKMLKTLLRENKLSDGSITRSALQQLESMVIDLNNPVLLKNLPGLKSNRRAVFCSGLANMQSVMDHLGIDKVQYVEFALREGLLFSMIREGADFNLMSSEAILALLKK